MVIILRIEQRQKFHDQFQRLGRFARRYEHVQTMNGFGKTSDVSLEGTPIFFIPIPIELLSGSSNGLIRFPFLPKYFRLRTKCKIDVDRFCVGNRLR